MSLPEDDHNQRALSREWAAARIVVIGGLVVAIAVAGYFAWRARQAAVAEQQASAPVVVAPKPVDAQTLARVQLAVCSAEIQQAINLGIIPTYGRLDTPRLARTAVPRRFICVAATHLAKYFVAADLRCDNLADPRCVSIFRVALKDGTLVYSRPE